MTKIQQGDIVQCTVDGYKSYNYGDLAIVKRVELNALGNFVLILANHLCTYGESNYSVENWSFYERPITKPKKEKPMGYVKSQYFAMRLAPKYTESNFLPLDQEEQTVLRSTRREAMLDIRNRLKEGEEWVILNTICFVKPAVPKPVLMDVEITECSN